jgi:tetratricopeptide (TPR) repeat protein
MAREVAASLGRPDEEDWLADQEALTLAYSGRLGDSRKKSDRAVALAERAGQRERAAQFEAGAAVREALFGEKDAARRYAKAALARSTFRDVEYGAAFALALSADATESHRLMSDLEKRFPEDTVVRLSYVPQLRVLLTPQGGPDKDPHAQIELLQPGVPYELGTPPCSTIAFFGSLYPVYVRGTVYLAAHKGAEAATEFQKILDRRGIVSNDPIGALARLQLGRAFALSGDRPRARMAYQDFLALWKDADTEIPIFRDARAEYARLK